jgi:predicted amidophosphoribosyltransferase
MNACDTAEPEAGLPATLTLLDAPSRADHAFLTASDRCAFLAQYLGGKSYRAGRCNQLIRNFKCAPSVARIDSRREGYKQHAIATLARWLRGALTREQAERFTWVPIPPSKRRGDPDFDDRLARTLRLAFHAYDVDVRGLLFQIRSTVPDHAGQVRLSAQALYDNLRLDVESLIARPIRKRIALFDDVLTSGKHYKCCERRLREALPCTPITGVFLMRRALPARWRSLG